MAKLSIVIPSRDEKFLTPTIDDIFRNARGEVEVIAVLDSNIWPSDWKEVTDRHPNLHTIHNGSSKGMRYSINAGVASARSRGAKYVMKSDAHCSFSEGFDEILKADHQPNWVVVPRRGRLDPERWCRTDENKPDIDYHYLSFPDDPNDFGGPGLNGKIWPERALERQDILVDSEMSSQGSCWFTEINYFHELELMDAKSYSEFWSEMQEIGLKCWLSGGQLMVNKKCTYLHLHKGRKYGRGYHLKESWLQQGASFTKNWIWNEAWSKQTLPFKWLIEHFWPVPTWPHNWEEILYAQRKPRVVGVGLDTGTGTSPQDKQLPEDTPTTNSGLQIRSAHYGISSTEFVDVAEQLRSLITNDSLDIIVGNSVLTPNQNPFRGKKKMLRIKYSINGGEEVFRTVEEKDWLIIGPVGRETESSRSQVGLSSAEILVADDGRQLESGAPAPTTPTALNDYLIRRFQISPQRLRGPMPIEVPQFHRNDLAQLFAELGFKRGAEIGVAEGNYSEILLKANPECELLLVDPWHHYSENPQGKSKEKHEFALNQVYRKTAGYKVLIYQENSMDAIQQVPDVPLDFVYIDGNHLFDYVMQDLIEWSKRVRSGGIVSGDDYYALDQKRWVGGGVVEAVQAYTNAHRIPIWFLFQGHKSVDYFWVKP